MRKQLVLLLFAVFASFYTKAGVYYWVGGTGNWSQFNTHWATTSGGNVFHIQTPTFADTVVFDANSFTAPGQIVWVDSTFIYCKDMVWTNVTNNPVLKNLYSSNNNIIKIYGSLILSQSMNWGYGGGISFESDTTGNIITSASHELPGVAFNGVGGEWILTDSLSAGGITVNEGVLRTNNQNISSASDILISGATVYLGTSIVRVDPNGTAGTSEWRVFEPSTVDADSATFYVDYAFYGGTAHTYDKVFLLNGPHLEGDSCNIHFAQSFYGNTDMGLNACSVDTLLLFNVGMLQSSSNNFGYTHIAGNAQAWIGNGTYFHYLLIDGEAQFSGNNSFDTLIFTVPGKTITLQAGATQTINNLLSINANGGFPVTLNSDQPGLQASLAKSADTVCLNYIFMQDINATGGAQFYAGQYSSDISNNTGWNWIDCQQAISNVWPGDANYDLITNNLDIIYLGLAYNETGFIRPNASNNYIAQPAMDWNRVYTNLVNIKHADCDGNGLIDQNDTLAVSLNYALTNTGRQTASGSHTSSSGPDIYFASTAGTYLPGSWVSIPIALGTTSLPATNIYGLAFTIDYDNTKIQPGTVSISYNGSWLVGSGNLVHLEKDFFANGKVDVGLARINHSNASGNGTIAYLNFQVSPSAPAGPINLNFSNITVMSYNENVVTVNPLPNSVTVGTEYVSVASNIKTYPNPFQREITLDYSLAFASGIQILLMEMNGSVIKSITKPQQAAGNHRENIDLSDLPAGIYFCKIRFNNGEKCFKLMKTE